MRANRQQCQNEPQRARLLPALTARPPGEVTARKLTTFTTFHVAIGSAISGTSANTNTIQLLNLTVSDPPPFTPKTFGAERDAIHRQQARRVDRRAEEMRRT